MAKLTDVKCEYTGGGIYVYTARFNDEVWLVTDFTASDAVGSYDTPWEVITDELDCAYDEHWKDASVPYPTWYDIMYSVYESCDSSTYSDIVRIMDRYGLPMHQRILGADDPTPGPSARLETLDAVIEIFEEFLDNKGIVIPNDEKDDDPDASNIYGTDYSDLSDRLSKLFIRLGFMKEE